MEPTTAELIAEIDQLRAEVRALNSPVATPESSPPANHTRRQAFRLAGAATAAAVVGSAAVARPAAAADPNDFVKDAINPVKATTFITGTTAFNLLQLSNNGTGGAITVLNTNPAGTQPGIRVSIDSKAAALEAEARRGVDVAAVGSGRIRLNAHNFSTTNVYRAGEIHQTDGTLFAMVTPTTRRVVAGPATAGAFHLIEPVRVYDSRRPAPLPGKLTSGTSRLVSIADGRDLSTGSAINLNVVPVNATGVAFNLTITDTSNSGFLSIAPGSATAAKASIINWSSGGVTLANASAVGVDANRRVRVFCGGGGSTHFLVDVVGYYL